MIGLWCIPRMNINSAKSQNYFDCFENNVYFINKIRFSVEHCSLTSTFYYLFLYILWLCIYTMQLQDILQLARMKVSNISHIQPESSRSQSTANRTLLYFIYIATYIFKIIQLKIVKCKFSCSVVNPLLFHCLSLCLYLLNIL